MSESLTLGEELGLNLDPATPGTPEDPTLADYLAVAVLDLSAPSANYWALAGWFRDALAVHLDKDHAEAYGNYLSHAVAKVHADDWQGEPQYSTYAHTVYYIACVVPLRILGSDGTWLTPAELLEEYGESPRHPWEADA